MSSLPPASTSGAALPGCGALAVGRAVAVGGRLLDSFFADEVAAVGSAAALPSYPDEDDEDADHWQAWQEVASAPLVEPDVDEREFFGLGDA